MLSTYRKAAQEEEGRKKKERGCDAYSNVYHTSRGRLFVGTRRRFARP